MTSNLPCITGIGSVSPYGTLSGAIAPRQLQPRLITAWPVAGVRRAHLVEPFRPLDVVPGLKTRRLDRLSVWSLVAASLAIKDSGIDLVQMDRSRVAVVCATGLGCIELTEAFFGSAAAHGWYQTDPIIFPETLGNAPASHVARHLDLRGPNITVGSKGIAAECALLHAASLLRNRQADLVLILSGDTLTRTSYEWYETAGMLSPACFNSEPIMEGSGFIPSEGVTAMLLEPAVSGHRASAFHSYANLRSGLSASGADPATVIRKVLNELSPGQGISCIGTAYGVGQTAMASLREILRENMTILPPDAIATGLGDTGALARLSVALSYAPRGVPILLLGGSAAAGFAALLMELP